MTQGTLTNTVLKIAELNQQMIQQTDRLGSVDRVIGQRDGESAFVAGGRKVFRSQPKGPEILIRRLQQAGHWRFIAIQCVGQIAVWRCPGTGIAKHR